MADRPRGGKPAALCYVPGMGEANRQSPLIEAVDWGRMQVAGLGEGKDFKLWPGGGRAWDWRETGTRHMPGIQPADLEELLEHGATEVVLSRGMWRALQTCPETLELLERQGIPVHRAETRAAVELYNERARQGVAVGGLFHSTC